MHSNNHKVYSFLKDFFTDVSREILERHRQITTIWQSLPILSKVLILIRWIMMIPFILSFTFSILLTLVFVIPGLFLFYRWMSMLTTNHSNTGDMNVPTFYVSETGTERDEMGLLFVIPVVGVVFGGIHCVGWFFNFPSSDEAMLWRVSSAVLTGTAFLFPIFLSIVGHLEFFSSSSHRRIFFTTLLSIILLVYVVSRLLLLVEAFISLRHLTPGMIVLVKWTSFIPHI